MPYLATAHCDFQICHQYIYINITSGLLRFIRIHPRVFVFAQLMCETIFLRILSKSLKKQETPSLLVLLVLVFVLKCFNVSQQSYTMCTLIHTKNVEQFFSEIRLQCEITKLGGKANLIFGEQMPTY